LVLYMQRVGDVGEGTPPPVPDQIAAIVELVETTPKEQLPLVLRSLNSPTLRIRVVDAEPAPTVGATNLPTLHWIVARYLDVLGGRQVRVRLQPQDLSVPNEPLSLAGRPLRIDVQLRDGRWISGEVRGELLSRAIGVPIAFAALVLTLIVAGATLWAIRREVRPLESLSAATERFGTQLDATRHDERGSREVRGLIGAFNRMQDRIRALVEGRTRMLAAISHDVGTYLTRLRLRAEFIDDADQRGRAVRDIGEMQALLADSLALARLERDDAPLGQSDLASVVRAQAEAFAADGATITLGPITEPIVVKGSDVALGRLVANLISNAAKYGGGAEVSLKRCGGSAELVVEDRGPGIPAEQREQVLEPFFRRDEARNLNAPGSGLGLAIANDITRRVGGILALDDREGGGLRVTVTLPLATQG
jgi:two-component system, OmpR family, osmolarity sensor histidine kinase EnvZ